MTRNSDASHAISHQAGATAENQPLLDWRFPIPTAPDDLSFVVYDTETTGLSKCFDQILQIAFARLGADLGWPENQEDAVEFRSRLRRDVIPAPAALMTTRTKPDTLEAPSLSFYEMMDQTAETFKRFSPCIFVGHNTLRFDEEMLRHNLFAALQPAYLTQAKDCARLDTLILMHAANLLQPGALRVPRAVSTKATYRLGPVVRENGITFDESDAHDAMADVRATAALLQTIKLKAPSSFDLMIWLADKSNALSLLRSGEVIGFATPAGAATTLRPVIGVVGLPNNPNAYLVVDLMVDPDTYLGLDDLDLAQLLGNYRRSPFRRVKANALPILLPMKTQGLAKMLLGDSDPNLESNTVANSRGTGEAAWSVRNENDRASRFAHQLDERAAQIRQNKRLGERLIRILVSQDAARPISECIEEQLYSGGFPSRADSYLADRFRRASPQERVKLIREFSDQRWKVFAERLVFFETPDALDHQKRIEMEAMLRSRLNAAETSPWRTFDAALSEIQSLRGCEIESAELTVIEQFPDPPISEFEGDTGVPILDIKGAADVETLRSSFVFETTRPALEDLDEIEDWLKRRQQALAGFAQAGAKEFPWQ